MQERTNRRYRQGSIADIEGTGLQGEKLEPDMSRIPVRPYLVTKDPDGRFRLTVRETRYNSQKYPIVTAVLQAESFPTATADKCYEVVFLG